MFRLAKIKKIIMNTFTQQGHIQLLKCDSEDNYKGAKDFCLKNAILLKVSWKKIVFP